MRVTSRTRLLLRLQNAAFVILFLAIVGLLGWLSTRYVHEADWTASGRNTLADASITLLRELPGEVLVTAYAREAPPLLRRQITSLVARYQRHKPDIILEFVNPDREPQRMRELNLADGELVIRHGDHEQRLRELSENGLTNALQRLARGEGRSLLFLAGHGERDPAGPADHDYLAWVEQLRGIGIGSGRVNLVESGTIPPETTALVIASPVSDLFPGEVAMITDFIERGGNLLWLVDPDGDLHGLDPLAERLGIRIKPGTVVDPAVSQVGLMLFGIDDPRVALVAAYPEHELVRGFDRNTLYPIAGAIAIAGATDFDTAPVLETLSGTWLESGEVMGMIAYDEGEDIPGPLTLGVALTRMLDDGEALRTQRILVVADSDFLSNAFLGMAGNLQLGINIANWLGSDDRFIDIPIRTAPDQGLEFTPVTTAIIGFGFLLVMPLLLIGSGLLIWFRRRRR